MTATLLLALLLAGLQAIYVNGTSNSLKVCSFNVWYEFPVSTASYELGGCIFRDTVK